MGYCKGMMRRDDAIPDLVDLTEAADLLGLSKQGTLNLANSGDLDGARIGRSYVFRRAAVLDLYTRRRRDRPE